MQLIAEAAIKIICKKGLAIILATPFLFISSTAFTLKVESLALFSPAYE
jgi:hypothetical protein